MQAIELSVTAASLFLILNICISSLGQNFRTVLKISLI